jgi:hypothetical protein
MLFPFIIASKLVINMKDKQKTIGWWTIKAVLWFIVAIFVAGIVFIGFVVTSCGLK